MSSYDAVVVGAGLAGLTFACDLSGRGFRVLLVGVGKEREYEQTEQRSHGCLRAGVV